LETVYGWTKGGPISGESENNIASSSISMFINEEKNLPDLWELKTIGIWDSADQVEKKVHDELVKQKLQSSLQRKEDGRYQVQLPTG